MSTEIKRTAGQPALYNSPEELSIKIEQYFEELKAEKEEPTVTGLALYLGFESRQSLYDYGKREEFSYIIKRAKLRVENGYEKALRLNNATGPIFALKNMGWKDKTETDITTNGENMNTSASDLLVLANSINNLANKSDNE